jgi:hypothetical protein
MGTCTEVVDNGTVGRDSFPAKSVKKMHRLPIDFHRFFTPRSTFSLRSIFFKSIGRYEFSSGFSFVLNLFHNTLIWSINI